MSPPAAEPKNVLLLDVWSDRNRGDAAMQIALVRLIRRRLPQSRITAMTVLGANQSSTIAGEFDETGPLVDEIVGGFRPTTAPIGSRQARALWVRKAVGAASLLAGFVALPIWPVAARSRAVRALLPRSLQRTVLAMQSADLVIWRGRNFRANSIGREPVEVWTRIYNPLVALMLGKPVACIGSSVWPLRHPLARLMVRSVAGRALFVSLREQASFDCAATLLHDKPVRLELLPDLSLVIVAGEKASIAHRQLPAKPARLGVTLNDWRGCGRKAHDEYVRALVRFLGRFLEGGGTEVVLIPQVTLAMERADSIERILVEKLGADRVRVVAGSPSVMELTSLYAGIDLLIATRLHSAVFALCQGTPVVAIPYDAGAKWGVLDTIGARDLDVPFDGLTADLLARKVEAVWERREELLASVRAALPAAVGAIETAVDTAVAMYVNGTHAGRPARARRRRDDA